MSWSGIITRKCCYEAQINSCERLTTLTGPTAVLGIKPDPTVANTHSSAASVAACLMWIGVRVWSDKMANQGLITLVLF